MYARVTRVAMKPDQYEKATDITDTEILPEMKDDPGFKGIYILGDRTSGESLILTLWESEDNERSSREKVGKRIGMLSETLAGEPEPSMTYEVIHSHVPAQSPAM